MSIFLLPALTSLVFKLFVLAHVLKGAKISPLFLSLITVFAIHNSIEAIGYYFHYVENLPDTTSLFFRPYYVATIFLMLYVLLHSLSVSKLQNIYATTLLISISSVISFLVLFTDSVIAGQYIIAYTMTAIKGPFFWLFSVFVISFLTSSLVVLLYGYKNSTAKIEKTRCKISLIALSPILATFSIVIVLKTIEAKINAAGIAPIATTLFLIIVLKTESQHKLSNIRRFLPLSLERQTANNFLSLLDNYVKNENRENAYKDLQYGIETEIVSYSLKKCDNNIAHTAKMMGIRNRSTLYAMINRLNIDISRKLKQ